MKKNTSNLKGFTLIELLVVISIIGVLATVILGVIGDARIKAQNSKTISQLKEMQKAIVLNELNTGAWSNDVSPGVGCEPCRVGQAPPSFVTAGYFSRDGYENPKWNGKSVCYDYQNWLASSNPAIRYVSVDVYENTDTCGTLIPLKMCVYDPNNLCTNDLL